MKRAFFASFLAIFSIVQGVTIPMSIDNNVQSAFKSAGLSVLREKAAVPPFSLTTLAGGKVNLADYKGKVVFLNFWATWCGPCRAEMPSMEALYNQLNPDDFVILAVDMMEKQKTVDDYATQNGFTFPLLLDTDGKVSGAYGIQSIPSTFIIDRDGFLIARVVGSKNWNDAKTLSAFNTLLKAGR